MTRKRLIWLLGVALVLILLGGLLLPALPPERYTRVDWHYCTNCGARLRVEETGKVGSPAPRSRQESIHESDLSTWLKEHVDRDCEHEWVRTDTSIDRYVSVLGIRLLDGVREEGSCRRPRFLSLWKEDLSTLERLRRESPARCKEYIRKRLDPDYRGE